MADIDTMFSELTSVTLKYVDAIDDLIKCLEEEKANTIALWGMLAKRQHAIKAKDQSNANG